MRRRDASCPCVGRAPGPVQTPTTRVRIPAPRRERCSDRATEAEPEVPSTPPLDRRSVLVESGNPAHVAGSRGRRLGCGEGIRTLDLRVMSPTSCRCSTPPADGSRRTRFGQTHPDLQRPPASNASAGPHRAGCVQLVHGSSQARRPSRRRTTGHASYAYRIPTHRRRSRPRDPTLHHASVGTSAASAAAASTTGAGRVRSRCPPIANPMTSDDISTAENT